MVHDQLVGIDAEGRYHPQMLEGWQVSDDRLTWTFTLREGLEFSDGSPVTAEDCVASIRRWAQREALGRLMMKAAESFEVVDARRFVVKLQRPFAFVVEALGKPAGHHARAPRRPAGECCGARGGRFWPLPVPPSCRPASTPM